MTKQKTGKKNKTKIEEKEPEVNRLSGYKQERSERVSGQYQAPSLKIEQGD